MVLHPRLRRAVGADRMAAELAVHRLCLESAGRRADPNDDSQPVSSDRRHLWIFRGHRGAGGLDRLGGSVARPLAELEPAQIRRSEEHTSELQSLMRISY